METPKLFVAQIPEESIEIGGWKIPSLMGALERCNRQIPKGHFYRNLSSWSDFDLVVFFIIERPINFFSNASDYFPRRAAIQPDSIGASFYKDCKL